MLGLFYVYFSVTLMWYASYGFGLEISKNNKIPDEDDVRIKEKEIILSKNQLRELLEKHEDYVKNNYNENRQRENELLMQQKLEEMSGDENNENQNSSSNKIKKKKKKKRKKNNQKRRNQGKKRKRKRRKINDSLAIFCICFCCF